MVLRYNYTLARCSHKNKVKLEQVDIHTSRILCTFCKKEIWRWSKFNDDTFNIDEQIAKSAFILGKPTQLTEQEKELLI